MKIRDLTKNEDTKVVLEEELFVDFGWDYRFCGTTWYVARYSLKACITIVSIRNT